MRTIAALAVAVALWAEDPRFGVQSRLVMIPVTVTNAKGQSIDGLEPPDFVILDNGRPQTAVVDAFATGVAPIALVVAVQSSGISAAVLAKVQKIAGMIQPLVTGERGCAALVAFDEDVRWHQECTNDYDALALAFRRLQPVEHKSGRMLDAVHEAIERLRKRPNARRVVFVISESRDRGSETSLDSVVMDAQAGGVTVYAASYSAFTTAFTAKPSEASAPPPSKDPPKYEPKPPPSPSNPPVAPMDQRVDILGGIGELARLGKPNTARVLTGSTGGAVYSFTRQKGLEEAIEKLGAELHTQYVLSFVPKAPAPGYHRLEVRLARPNGYRIRARPGYWSPEGVR